MTVASFIAAQRAEHAVPHALSCRALDVAPSTFYKWHNRQPTARQRRRDELDRAVRASFNDSGGTPGTYGSPRVWEDLIEAGWKISKKTVAASMARQGLAGRSPKRKRRSLTRPDKAAAPIPDLLGRDFTASAINQRWCGDLTEIPTDEGKLYLAIVEDLASRRLPGFAIGEHHDAALARGALCMAAATRGGSIAGVIFHTDKGGEYTGDLFAAACAALGVWASPRFVEALVVRFGWSGDALLTVHCGSIRSEIATGSSQCGQAAPGPRDRQKRLHSSQRWEPR